MSSLGTPQQGQSGRSGTRQLRNRLALTTILTVAPFFGYGRAAYAACDPSPASPTFVCTGANVVTQAVTANNANVSTAPGFSVIVPAGNGITVTGDGHVRFTDQNASTITGDEDGLSVVATGDAGATPGAVTVTVNSTITGGHNGIRANNNGTGDLVVTADGKVTGQNVTGLLAGVGSNGSNLTVNTGTQSDVTGYRFGIDARSSGTGDIIINANGKVTATDGDGMHAFTTGRDLTITTGADSVITGSRFGMIGRNDGTGDLAITVNGEVTGMAREGVYALGNSTANNVTVTIAAGSTVKGGYDGVEARSIGRGALNVKVYGDVTGTVQNGVWVVNYAGTSATVITGAQSKVTGYDGIGGRNDSGDFTITANGEVTGTGRDGIRAINTVGANDLKITTGAQSEITGKQFGIYARNFGRDIDITVKGEVTAEQGDGIRAENAYVSTPTPTGFGRDLKITTGAASSVTGYGNGIFARNNGTGDLKITADGKVTGEGGYGISARNWYNGDSLEIITGAGSEIDGQLMGISARNGGAGALTITANGIVNGRQGAGIRAQNGSASDSLKIVTGAASMVTGYGDGIQAGDNGSGDLEITVGGTVKGRTGTGVQASNTANGNDLKIISSAGSAIEGRTYGIFASNSGNNLIVTVAGDVSAGAGHGIRARNLVGSNDLIVTVETTSTVKAQSGGLIATNGGSGVVDVTVRGVVEGTEGTGIHAASTTAGGGVRIATSAGSQVTGGLNGIQAFDESDLAIAITVGGDVRGMAENGLYVRNFGDGGADIKVGATGRVEGMVAGIDVESTGGPVVISNAGLITASSLLAIDATDSAVANISNSGVINGRVHLTNGGDRFDNLAGGVFAARGSDFGGGNDVVNNAGLVQAAHGIAEYENVFFESLETFNNSGTVSLVDGLANDQFGMGSAANYVGQSGRLAVDAFLAPGADGKSDKLIVFGSTSGTTTLVINLTNPIGSAPNTDGIRVVVVDGTSLAEDFRVEGGVLNAGFFAWDLRRVQDGISVEHQLYTTGLGAGAYEFAAGITGAQDMWQQTTGTLLQRQADLRPLIAGTQVTPVADFADPVVPTPVGRVTPGLWFKAVGGWLDRDADADNNVVLDRKQTVFGGIAGFDFGTENVSGQGDALLFGLFGGYLTSKLSFDSTNTEWTYDGPTIGAYATYLNDAFYADLVVKADFVDIDIDAGDLAPGAEADTNATNIGGQLDLGYKIGLGQGAFIEPQASLSVLHTEIDDIDDIFGGSVEFDDETSLRGRLGLRLGADYEHNGLLLTPDVTASVWQSFSGDNNVTVLAPLTPASDVSDDPGETMGDISLGLAVTAPTGWTGFLRGNYQFAEDFDAITGAAGLRYAW
jgi:autotransporter family porin